MERIGTRMRRNNLRKWKRKRLKLRAKRKEKQKWDGVGDKEK